MAPVSADMIEMASPALAAAIANMLAGTPDTIVPNADVNNKHSSGSRVDGYSQKHAGKRYSDAHLLRQGYKLAAVFPYDMPDGTKLYEERRYELRDGIVPTKDLERKTCRFCHSVNGVDLFDTGPRRIVYNWPAIMRAGPDATVHITEGASKSAPLNSAGLLATAVAYHQWVPECISALAGRRLIYHEDHDDNGRKFSADARKHLAPVAASFSIVPAADLFKSLGKEPPPHADVKDWIEAGGDVAKLEEICRANTSADETLEIFTADALQTMVFAPINFVVPGLIAEGLTLFAGKPKIGKSWLLMHAAWAVAAGSSTLGGIQVEAGDVFYAALEDNKRRLSRRMTRLFGKEQWPPGLHFACQMKKLADGGLDQIKRWIGKAKHPRLIIIDTLKMVRTPARKDQNYYEADYESVRELRDLAAEHSIAIVVVHHLRKAEADDPFDTVSGTLGLTGAVDTIMLLYREGNGVILSAKGRDVEERCRGNHQGSDVQSRSLHVVGYW
jgi:hypothetical protein